jgi:hypothetical protein
MRQIILKIHFMEDILLQTIIDKLEALDKTNEKLSKTVESATNYDPAFKDVSEKIRMTQMAVQGIPDLISIPGKEIQAQRESMIHLTERLKQPLKQKVKTVHYINPPFLLSAVLMGIIIWLGTWVYILYPGSQQMGKATFSPIATPSIENYPKENLPKVHKSKQKNLPVKNPIQDSAARAKQMRIDSLYKILMHGYDQKRAGKHATAADDQPPKAQR